MEHYKNLGGRSGVTAYEAGPDFIEVDFHNGSRYRYDYGNPGPERTEEMKRRAALGWGLNTYINKEVKTRYAARLR